MPKWLPSSVGLLIALLTASAAAGLAGAQEEPAVLPPDPAPLLAEGRRAVMDGRLEEAERALRDALDRYRQRDDRVGVRTALLELSLVLSDLGRADEAVALLQEALPLADAAADRSAPVVVRVQLAEVQLRAGRLGEALSWVDAALAATVASEDVGLIGIAGLAYLQVSRSVDDGDAGVRASLDFVDGRLAEVPGYVSVDQLSEAIYELGAQRLVQGNARGAFEAMSGAARIAAVTGDAGVLADYRFGAGYAALHGGELDVARTEFLACTSGPRAVAALTGLGEIDASSGWTAGADGWFQEAQRQAKDRGDAGDEAYLAGRRAALASSSGDLDAARKGFEEAAGLYADTGETLGEVEARARGAAVLFRLGRWDEARRQAQRSLAENRETFAAPGVSTGYRSVDDALAAVAVLEGVARKLGREDEAAAELDRFVALARERGRCGALVAGRASRAAAHAQGGDVDAASSELSAALEEGDELDCEVWPLQLEQARVAARLGDDAQAEELLEEAVAGVEAAPAPAPDPLLVLAPDRWAPHRALVERLSLAGRGEEALEVHWRALAVRHGVAHGGAGTALDAVPPGATGLFVASLEDETLLWVSHDGGVALHRTETPASLLVEQAALLTAAMADEGDPSAWEPPSRALYAALIEPVEEALTGGVLAISADGPVASIPWAALRGDDGFLVERVAVVGLAPGLSPAATEPSRWKARSATVMLRGPCEERPKIVAAVGKRAKDTTVLRGGEVTEEAWRGAAAEADVVVLALPVEGHAVESGRVRIGVHGDEGEDRWWPLEPHPPEPWSARVVAWACPAPPAVARGVRAAGAGPVLLPLWDPGDEASAELLGDWLKGAERHGAVGALQRVQRAHIKAGSAPRAWAGWIVY